MKEYEEEQAVEKEEEEKKEEEEDKETEEEQEQEKKIKERPWVNCGGCSCNWQRLNKKKLKRMREQMKNEKAS